MGMRPDDRLGRILKELRIRYDTIGLKTGHTPRTGALA